MTELNTAPASQDLVLNISGNHVQEVAKKVSKEGGFIDKLNDIVAELNPVSQKEILFFFELLGTLNNAGLPVIESLDILSRQTKNPKLKKIIKQIRNDMEEGSSFAESLRRHNKVFDEAKCSIIEAGEKSGKLNTILKELILQLEKMNFLRGQVKGVMLYPTIVIIVMAILTIILLIFVVPKLENIFDGRDNLPLPTQVLVNSSEYLIGNWFGIGFAAIVLTGLLLFWKTTMNGKRTIDIIGINTPIIGKILKKMILSRITRMFSLLLTAGVPIVESLKIAANVAGNHLYKEKLLLASEDISRGISIAENLADKEKLFPEICINMIAIGEKTASLDTVMGRVASFYDEELEREIKSLSKILEPFILAFIACGAVFMILAIYLPILKMNDTML